MSLEILTFPNKQLKEKSKEIKKISKTHEQLVREMFQTMYEAGGIGLAAPQVGELIRLVVVDVPIVNPINPEKQTPDPVCFINPLVISGQGQAETEEGCLSCPELIVKVTRFDWIELQYLDLEGNQHINPFTGLKAVCIQHEIDHLNGVLLVDKVTRLERDLYRNKRIKIAQSEKDLENVL